MMLKPIEEMNPVQIAFALVTTPRTIETIEFVLKDETYGSGTREDWEKRLSDLKSWYEELKSIDKHNSQSRDGHLGADTISESYSDAELTGPPGSTLKKGERI